MNPYRSPLSVGVQKPAENKTASGGTEDRLNTISSEDCPEIENFVNWWIIEWTRLFDYSYWSIDITIEFTFDRVIKFSTTDYLWLRVLYQQPRTPIESALDPCLQDRGGTRVKESHLRILANFTSLSIGYWIYATWVLDVGIIRVENSRYASR